MVWFPGPSRHPFSWLPGPLLVSLSFSLWRHGHAHPSRGIDPLASAACADDQNVTFYSFHVHVIFDDYERSPTRVAALQLQQAFAKAFHIPSAVDPTSCDDTNTTHGKGPGLCMIDDDFGPKDPASGHYGSGACPFLQAEWAAFVPVDMFQRVVNWFMKHHGGLDVVVHPNSGCEVYDHRNWLLWIGQPHRLDLTCLHYDCPGCSINDCETRSQRIVLEGHAERCGLTRFGDLGKAAEAGNRFVVGNRSSFCSPSCMEWVQEVLPHWYGECPFNCDFYSANATRRQECDALTGSLPNLLEWSSLCQRAAADMLV